MARLVNLDLTIFAQEPKLGPLKSAMRLSVANILQVDPDAVNVKAKTGERVVVRSDGRRGDRLSRRRPDREKGICLRGAE